MGGSYTGRRNRRCMPCDTGARFNLPGDLAMKVAPFLLSLGVAAVLTVSAPSVVPVAVAADAAANSCPAWLNHEFRKLHSSQKINICKDFAGKPLLIVNTASGCGFTPQFKGLQAVHDKYKDRGLVVIGFASNDFNQENADEAKSAEICEQNYGVKFTMLSATNVKGAAANPVFAELIKQKQAPAWNFNKYFVKADGKVETYFASAVTPESAQFTTAVESLLK
jgi:glutathione peroxidase